jgi:thiamine biosynthesis lipoprotein
MRFADALLLAASAAGVACAAHGSEPLQNTPIQQQRYSMGTMFEIVAYHEPRADAERAVAAALDEISRLDEVLSDYSKDSELSRLVREGRKAAVTVDPALFEVLQESLVISRRSGGVFDVTIAPVLRAWRDAREQDRQPTEAEIAAAKRCVGHDKIELPAANQVRLRSECLEIDLGAIGKGYALDRAMAVLKEAGVRHASVNGGNSSIGAIGHPPGKTGWPVLLGAPLKGSKTLLLRDQFISTSSQSPAGHIVDPRSGGPARTPLAVTVVAPRGSTSDALSTALLLMSAEDGSAMLPHFAGVSALWIAGGQVTRAYGEGQLEVDASR